MTNLYDILNISENASVQEIKSAYKTLAKKYHPDINKEEYAEEFFKKINDAYNILIDKEKKYKYDKKNFHNKENFNNKGNFHNKDNKDLDINIVLELSITKAIKGGTTSIKLFGNNIKIKIPKNTTLNDIIKVKGKGNIINNKQGDLILHVKIIGNEFIKIDKLNIIEHINIKLNTAIFGKTITINTIIGEEIINIHEGTQFNEEIIIKNKGILDKETNIIGDLILIVNIEIPIGSKLNTKESSLYKTQKKLDNKIKILVFIKTLYREIKILLKENNYFYNKKESIKNNIIQKYNKINTSLKNKVTNIQNNKFNKIIIAIRDFVVKLINKYR
jgi:curved DNA-binding protein